MIKLYKGDCLIESDKIESGSVDLILTDLPYGTVGESMQDNTGKYSRINQSKWDNIIPTKKVLEIADRILRKNGKMLLFCQQPFTTELINSSIPSLPFSYTIFWDKLHFANCLGANKAMVNYMEECLLFSKSSGFAFYDFKGIHPLRSYNATLFNYIGLTHKEICKYTGSTYNSHYWTNGVQFAAITKKDYDIFIKNFKINKMDGFLTYEEMNSIDEKFKLDYKIERDEYYKKMNEQYPSTFNLWEDNKYKSNILKYKKDYNGYHPTQKPVLLLEDLIKTFSNENDLVVDLTMGSGSTMVACKNTNRNGIGIEMNDEYFSIAEKRVEKNIITTGKQETLFNAQT